MNKKQTANTPLVSLVVLVIGVVIGLFPLFLTYIPSLEPLASNLSYEVFTFNPLMIFPAVSSTGVIFYLFTKFRTKLGLIVNLILSISLGISFAVLIYGIYILDALSRL